MTQSAVIKNWVSQFINRHQWFNLLLLSITHFADFDLYSKIKYAYENKNITGKYLLNGYFFNSISKSRV